MPCYNAARMFVTVGVSQQLSAVKRDGENVLSEQLLSFCMDGLGIVGTIALLTFTGLVLWYYRGSRTGSIRWHWRNLRLKQVSALACLFFLAMAASFAVLHEAWAFVYLIAAFKTGTWWFRIAMSQRA